MNDNIHYCHLWYNLLRIQIAAKINVKMFECYLNILSNKTIIYSAHCGAGWTYSALIYNHNISETIIHDLHVV